jgi:hypothetical protein
VCLLSTVLRALGIIDVDGCTVGRRDLNCSRGYEWDVLEAAKARNPDIKVYGLTWGVPGACVPFNS